MRKEPISLYLHIPFCTLKCSYCDFNSYARLEDLIPPFVEAMTAELRLWSGAVRGRPVPTVFFGGGTPSLMPLDGLERTFAAMRERYDLEPDAEITLEANPGTVDLDYLRGLRSLGVNRISFGVQSFHDDELTALDRIHSAAEAKECYHWAREAGFERVNLDFIYGLTEQPMHRWQSTLEQAIALEPDHLSLYALTVEEGTKLAYDIDHGRVPEPDPDAQAAMYEWSCERLAAAGYQHYEISNWCRPGEECRHNLVYWRNGEWLGLGPGAHSHWVGYRFADAYSPKQYIRLVRETSDRGIDADAPPAGLLRSMGQVTFVDEQPPALAMADTMILGLRLNEGLRADDFRRRFGRAPEDVYGPILTEFTSLGLLERNGPTIRLTDRGRYIANELFVRLLPE